MFTLQPNLMVELGVHPSVHPNCHHQIVFAKFDLNISYPPPYSTEVWLNREANADLIRRVISNFNLEKAFYNTNVANKVSIFNETILNVLSNYILDETLTGDDKDPPWFNSRIKSLVQDKNKLYKDFQGSNTNAQLLNKLNHLQEQLNVLINRSKQNYYARMTKKRTDVSKNFKASLKQQKIPLIPPLFHENKFVTDFKEKAKLFNSHLATQCSLISNSSKLSSHTQYLTDNCLSCVGFSHDKICKSNSKPRPRQSARS